VMSQVPGSPKSFPDSPISNISTHTQELMFSEVVVYGVTVPLCGGKVGMAAVVLSPPVSPSPHPLDWAPLHLHLTSHLPPYARPLFLRVRKEVAVTSTFKHQKGELVQQGWSFPLQHQGRRGDPPHTRTRTENTDRSTEILRWV
jgi:acyl-CoA synthetase (AMP-forming)/AMP-acid ligase II